MKHPFALPIAILALAGCGRLQKPADVPPAPQPAPPVAKVRPPEPPEPKPEGKSVVALSPRAAAQARILMEDAGAKSVRVSISAEYEYRLYADGFFDAAADDFGESQGVPILVDRKSARRVSGGLAVDVTADGKEFAFAPVDPEQGPEVQPRSLLEARKGFETTIVRRERPRGRGYPRVAAPPAGTFDLVQYKSPLGDMNAYLTPDAKDGKKHPAIVWITGGDCNSIDEGCWTEGRADNEQSAGAYRKAGIAMMFPSLRGAVGNPGAREGLFGEVNDVLAAAEYLRKRPFVDPERIYLGGHSTGGTLVLLVAACPNPFRAIVSFGPANDMAGYDDEFIPFSKKDPKEFRLRAPERWLYAMESPTFVFEGSDGNWQPLRSMAKASKNPKVKFFEIAKAGHFEVLEPTNKLIAAKILSDTGKVCSLTFTANELDKPFAK